MRGAGLSVGMFVCLATACSSNARKTSLPTPPSDVAVASPAPGLPKRVAAFSGTWEGSWGDVLPSRLIVEHVNKDSAQVVYVWGDSPGMFEGGWRRNSAKVLDDAKLRFGRKPVLFTFTMSEDLRTITGEREQGDRLDYVTMSKVGRHGRTQITERRSGERPRHG